MGIINFRRGNALIDAGEAVVTFPSVASLIARYEGDNPAITTVQINQTFATTDVDVTNDRITLPNLSLGPVGMGEGSPVYFSSTGTLPGGLTAGTPYYLVPTGGTYTGTYDVYGYYNSSQWQSVPGMTPNDRVTVAQNAHQLTNKINITSQGSGTHTVTSNPLVNTIPPVSGDTRLNLVVGSASNRHSLFELKTDGGGRKGFYNTRSVQEIGNANYNDGGGAKGKVCPQTGDRVFARSFFGGARALWMTFVVNTDPVPFLRQCPKVYVTPAMVSGSVITLAKNHQFSTGDVVDVWASGTGATLPASLTAGTPYYVRNRAARSLSIHPTATDATNDTNAIVLAMGGSDAFSMAATAKVLNERWGFLAGVYGPDGGQAFNALAPRISHAGPVGNGIVSMSGTTVGVTGTNNGAWFLTGTGNNFEDLDKITVWFPPRSVPPVRSDTGLALASGDYWVTRQPGNNARIRLHLTLADAQASVGQTNALATSIKFNGATPSGQALFALAEGRDSFCTNNRYNTNTPTLATDINEQTPTVISFMTDYNDPAQPNVVYKVYVNGALVETFVDTATKANLPANDASSGAAWVFLSDLDAHVSFDGMCYSFCLGASASAVPDSDILAIHSFYRSKYGI